MAMNKAFMMQQNALMALLLVVLASVIPRINAQDDSSTADQITEANVSYIIEPFERLGGGIWNFSDPSISNFTTEGALYGDGALSIDFTAVGESSSSSEYDYEVSWMAERHPHNCFGASELSLAVKTESSMSIQVSILDDRECLQSGAAAADCNDLSQVSTIPLFPQPQELTGSSEWYHLSVPAVSIEQDLKRIRGWKIRVANATGTLLLDQFACHGGGGLLGAAFHVLSLPNETSFAQAKEESMWLEYFFESPLAVNNSVNTLEEGVLKMDYLVQQVQSWGGFNDVAHLAAGNGYYNLSQATGLTMDFDILKQASIPGRCIFRFVLQDGSHCMEDCDHQYHNQERWYSFNSIMDLQGGGTITLPLEGSTEATSTFWFTGWSGISGNKILDLAHIKGYTIEVVLDSGLDLFDSLTGTFELSNMTAVVLPEIDETCIGVLEKDLYFHEWSGDQFTRVEFLGAKCCELCEADPDCLYAMSNNRDCFIASELDPKFVSLLATEVTATFSSFWMDDPIKRGDWCDKCDCDQGSLTIDCKGKDLRVIPKTISVPWEPRLIDLQDNFRLVMIGSDSFAEVANSLEEIRFPTDVKFLSPGALDSLPKLNNVVFQSFFQDGVHRMVNAITTEADSFGDICCGFGSTIEINWELSITNCDMKVDAPGIDAVYDPFYNYLDATILRAVQEDSSFMREAAESVEKCAEFCAIDDDCNYFTYDQRLPNADHRCLMFQNNGTIFDYVCCLDDHYADEERTIPGTISGRPPSSRHRDDDARVLVSTTELSLTKSNNYATELTLSLGATPLRGAVWVYPKFTTGSSTLKFIVEPSHVPLYTSNSTAKIFVSLEQDPPAGSQSTTVLVELDIVACDEAFVIEDSDDEGIISLSVIPIELADTSNITTSIIVPATIICALFAAAFLWHDYKKRQNDMIWMVKQDELHFDSPPEVIGRGTFGLVLLAEYRGTQVAVKRVIPAKSKRSGAGGLSSVASAMSLPDQSEVDQTMTSDHVEESEREDMTEMAEAAILPVSKKNSFEMNSQAYLNSKSLKFATFQGSSTEKGVWKKLRKNFIEEMRQLSKLRHPCICTVMGAVIGKSVEPMLIMEYMDHGSLNDLLKNDTIVIDGEIILPILRDISQGLRFLHSANPQVIHGDLKAANILVDHKFRAKVADFGLSQKKQLGGTGTPYWMAPELLRKEAANSSASDVFSFGVILVEVYSRKDPYEGESTNNILEEIADKSIRRRPTVPENCPPQIRSMISDCLVDEAEMRPTFEELDTRLKRIDAEAADIKTRNSRINKTVSLFDIFPKKIAEALQEGRQVEAEHRDCVTIFFSDIVDFTSISSELDPRKVADLLDRLYTAFDEVSNAHDVFKVETIGDAYMAVTNLVKDQPDDHAKRIAEFSIAAIEAANETLIDTDDPSKGYVNIRCGFHSGPVVADVVGNKNPRYCLFGDTVNSAHRMESNSKSNRINCSRASADLLKVQCPDIPLRSRGKILIKGKGEMQTYWVNDNRRPSIVLSNPPLTGSKVFLNGMELALSQVDEGNETGMSEDFLADIEETKGSGHFTEPSSKSSISLPVQG